MRKKQFVWVFVFLLFVGVSSVSAHPLELGLDKAKEVAKEQNLDIRLARLRVKEAEGTLLRVMRVGNEEEIKEAEETLERVRESLEKTQEDLEIQIERSYYDLLRQEERVAELRASLADSEKNLLMEEARIVAGIISQLSFERTKNALERERNTYNTQWENLGTARYRFKELLGMDLKQEIQLTDSLTLSFVPLELGFEDALLFAMEHSDTMLAWLESKEKAEEAVRLADNAYTPIAQLEKARSDLARTLIEGEKARNRVFFEVRQSYLRVIQQEAVIEQIRRELAYAIKDEQVVQAQHKEGVVSDTVLQNARNAVETQKKALEDGIWEHMRARRDFYLLIGQPQPLGEDYGS